MLTINALSKSFDKGKSYALENVTFNLKAGQVCAIVGESGSGKTTLVRLIAGLERPDNGSITMNEKVIASLDKFVQPEKRKIGLVFQEYALFPHLTILENVLYGISKVKNKKEKAQEMLDLVGLSGMEKRYPHQLSGGQQQRVALARALAPEPSLLILDEPFSNLDTMLRTQLRNEVFDIIKKTEVTVLFVTHDTQDALSVADEILILQKGKVIQKDVAENLYVKPNTLYVASLFGNTVHINKNLQNAFRCPLKEDCCHAIRNEKIIVSQSSTEADCEYITAAKVIKKIPLGNATQLVLKLESGEQLTVMTQDQNIADTIYVGFNSKDILEFDQEL
ncbi:iron(III) transport system ATP-binding protein [Oceanihabitans sediminis]|uniref:ABC transporter ATP-binding protein n=2 Tax=Oceanihabitans sediminis TaxID=1812012 RepID=A0A368P4E7_9FLAO|nr:ABC transporter ATP-binding protein [Oceanihabitans sediminis]RBP28452.1 iron(III) transport system ATP-binding protein [Oceanihabitans sediminis]RCU56649.1 ABC transporter ATP-binding protein [Oceanihabitans sediminis]